MAEVSNIAASTVSPSDEQQKAKLAKAAKEFESVFVSYMLKTMRESMTTEDSFGGDNFGGDVLSSVFDTELARQMSKNSSFGLGEMIYRKLTGEDLPKQSSIPGVKATPAAIEPTSSSVKTNAKPTAVALTGGATTKTDKNVAAAKSSSAAEQAVASKQIPASVQDRLQQYDAIIRDAADTTGVSAHLIKAVIASESGGNAKAHSSKNAKGLMQLVDTTASDMGVQNVWDPKENIQGGTKYLQQLLDKFDGNVEHAVASYNAGPAAVEKYGGVPPYKETKAYVNRVLGYLKVFEQQEGGTSDQE